MKPVKTELVHQHEPILQGELLNQGEPRVELVNKATSVQQLNCAQDSLVEHLKERAALQQAQDRVKILIQENDRLIQENHILSDTMGDLEQKMTKLNWEVKSKSTTLEQTQEQVEKLQLKLNLVQDEKLMNERQLKVQEHGLADAHAEYDALKEKCRQLTFDTEEKQETIQELKMALQQVTGRYEAAVKEATCMADRERDLIDESNLKAKELEEFMVKYDEMVKMNKEKVLDAEQAQQKVRQLEKKVEVLQHKEIEYLDQQQQAKQLVEEARFEKESIEKRESNLIKKLNVLEQELADLPKRYQEKNEVHLQTLKSQQNGERRRFAEETSKLEELCAKLQNQAERAIREKRAAESELEKLSRHFPAEADRLTQSLEEMHSRLRAAEREKHEAMNKLETQLQKTNRLQNQYDADKLQLSDRSEEAYRRMRRLENDLEEEKKQRLHLLNKIADLENETKQLNEAKTRTMGQHTTQVNNLVQKYDGQVADLTSKLEIVSEAHARTCNELQQLLADQRRLSEKFKQESSQMQSHYETLVKKARDDIHQHKDRIAQLEQQLLMAQAQRKDLLDQVNHERKEKSMIHSKLIHADHRIEALARQINLLITKEAEMIDKSRKLRNII